MAKRVIETVIASAVATDGTIDFPYPSGVVEADIVVGGEVLALPSLQNVLDQAADTFTVAYGTSPATVTYKGETTIPAGSTVRLQIETLDVADADTDLPVATASYPGAVKKMPVQAASVAATAADAVVDFNLLLVKLKNAGIMASS